MEIKKITQSGQSLCLCKETIILYGQKKMTVQGCRRILQYVPQKICLELSEKVLCITGKNLICSSFSGRHTTVEGTITTVGFEDGKVEKT